MDAARPGLSLVIPAYNEAATVEQAVREADAALGALFAEYEILLVDDGSRDDTITIAAHLQLDHPRLRLLRHPANRGYGAALRTGFAAARFDLVAFTDADCQFDLGDLGPLADRAAVVPVVVGYRADRRDPWRRRFLSWGYNRLVRTLLGTGVRDCDCALKVFRRTALADLLPTSRGFFVNTEMLSRARRLGYAVEELPVAHRPRAGGDSKVSLWEVPKTLRVLLRFWWREVLFAPVAAERPTVLAARIPVSARLAAVPLAPAPRPSSGPPRPAALRGPRRGAA